MNNKVLIAMSGGVDSSVAAYIMKKNGFDCSGAIMELLDSSIKDNSDTSDARKVCEKMGIDFYVLDKRAEFKECVISSFVSAYENGATPNPCIECNRHLKFGSFLSEAEKLGIDHIATGHYAIIEKSGDRYYLKKGKDLTKDQSYVLYNLTQFQLSHTIFPLGEMTKEEIRAIAEEKGFVTARKKDSQDICFVPDGDYASFIKNYTQKDYPKGNFINLNGDVIGTHEGIIKYTIGQRKGLGTGFGEKVYVHSKNISANEVVLSKHDDLFSNALDAYDFNWISFDKAPDKIKAHAKVRYSAKETPCTVYASSDNEVHIEFDASQRAIAKGQSVVLYDGDYVLGGGIIK